MKYPFYNELEKISASMKKGNYGLWYNKFIPVKDFSSCKPSDDSNDKDSDTKAVDYYYSRYTATARNTLIKELLEKKHRNQVRFCQSLSSQYEIITVTAKLNSPLVTGIGESHPHEISMVFDHNIGIPYIPSSGIKGIVRFAHTLGLLNSITEEKIQDDGSFDDEAKETHIPALFGTQTNRGSVIFLDAYPETVPSLHIDIMNPHYGDYYSDESNKKPPGDYLNPTPIKFLTVAKGSVFVFRSLVDKKNTHLLEKVKTAYSGALTEEGVGAKTALGYGIFEVLKETEPDSIQKILQAEKEEELQREQEIKQKQEMERVASLSEDDRLIEEIKGLPKDPAIIAPTVKKCLEGNFKKEVYVELKKKLEELSEWKPEGSKQRKTGMKERNQKIENKIQSPE